jgi:hypothetical protein
MTPPVLLDDRQHRQHHQRTCFVKVLLLTQLLAHSSASASAATPLRGADVNADARLTQIPARPSARNPEGTLAISVPEAVC